MTKIILILSILTIVSAQIDPITRRVELLTPPRAYQHASRSTTPEKRIVNGEEAVLGQFPYQALVTSYFEHDEVALCGGSLISQNYVLTAAHCVEWDGIATHGNVVLGVQNRQLEEPTQQRIEYGSISIHPDWDVWTIRYDVGTIRLATPAVLNEYVQPVVLPALAETRTFSGITGTISGFGRTNDIPGSPPSDVLRYTSNPIMTNADCQAQLPTFELAPQHICLSAFGSRSGCHSDSGGPLTILEDGRTVQVGIISFGIGGLCTVGVPSGCVRITYFLDWIVQHSDVELRS